MAATDEKRSKCSGELPIVAPSAPSISFPRSRHRVSRLVLAVIAFVWVLSYSHHKFFNGVLLSREHSQGIYSEGGHFLTGKEAEDLFL
jgi:hypothetical protein